MSRVLMLLCALSMAPLSAAQSQAPPSAPAAGLPAMTDEQKTVYALGLLMHRSTRPFDLSPEEVAIVVRALMDAAAGTPVFDLTEWGPRIEPLANVRRSRVTAREKTASVAFLDEAATELGAVRTASGLVYRDLAVGPGATPTARDTVRVHYRGTLIDGTVFDSTLERNEPVAFRLNAVVPCWTEGVQRMKVGGKARFVCPSELAYGDAGSQGIPGGAALVFEVELVGIIGAAAFPPND